MAHKQALRDLQNRLAERLRTARTESRGKSWLAVECASHGFLFPLVDAGEIFPMAPLVPVPHSRDWFLGVSNLRGHLHGVVHLGGFLGLGGAGPRDQSRLVGFNQALDLNCVLLVDRLTGLRSEGDMTPAGDDADERPGFAGARYRDAAARTWQELRLAELARDESFLRIVS